MCVRRRNCTARRCACLRAYSRNFVNLSDFAQRVLLRKFCKPHRHNRLCVCRRANRGSFNAHRSIGLRSCSPMRDALVYVRQLQRVHCAPVRACACVCETHTGEDPTAIGRGMYNKFSAGVAVGATLKEVFGFCVRRARARLCQVKVESTLACIRTHTLENAARCIRLSSSESCVCAWN